MRHLIIFFFILFGIAGIGQNNIDSLWDAWQNHAITDSNRFVAIRTIAFDEKLSGNLDTIFHFIALMNKEAKNLHNEYWRADAIFIKAYHLARTDSKDSALILYDSSLSIYTRINETYKMSLVQGNLGVTYRDLKKYEKAEVHFKIALELAKKVDRRDKMIQYLDHLAGINYLKANYSEAAKYYYQSLNLSEEASDELKVAECLNNLGRIYNVMNENEKALEYYKRGFDICKKLNKLYHQSIIGNNIGMAYAAMDSSKKALTYYMKSYHISEELDDKYNMANSLNNIAILYGERNERDSALFVYKKSLKLYTEVNNARGVCIGNRNISNQYYFKKQYDQAIYHGKIAFEMAVNIGHVDLIRDVSETLYLSYKAIGKHSLALEMYEKFVLYGDSLESEENQREIIRQEYKYAYEKEALSDSIKGAEAKKVLDAEIEAQTAELKQERTQRFALYGGVLVLLLFGGFIFKRYKQSQAQKAIIQEQKEAVEEAHQEITDSIAYAKRIQSAILPPARIVKEYLKDSFILYKPKDQVAGDFYWMEHKAGRVLFAAADCTGHGVPGAMVSVICNNGLNRSVREYGLTDPGKILDKTREIVIQEFEKSEEDVKDGMDIALCSLEGMKLQYAGAHNPLWIVRNKEVLETKADKQPIGKYDHFKPYSTHSIDLESGDGIYIFSDGFVDQFGGEKGKKFMAKNLKSLLVSIQDKSMEDQRSLIDDAFEAWRKNEPQVDDVCVIGVRV